MKQQPLNFGHSDLPLFSALPEEARQPLVIAARAFTHYDCKGLVAICPVTFAYLMARDGDVSLIGEQDDGSGVDHAEIREAVSQDISAPDLHGDGYTMGFVDGFDGEQSDYQDLILQIEHLGGADLWARSFLRGYWDGALFRASMA